MVRVLEALLGRQRRGLGEISPQLLCVEIGPTVLKLPAVSPVADEAGAVREKLGRPRSGDRRVQPHDEVARGVVEAQPPRLAQLQDAGGREALRVGGDAEAVASGERLPGPQVRRAERRLEHDLAPVCYCERILACARRGAGIRASAARSPARPRAIGP